MIFKKKIPLDCAGWGVLGACPGSPGIPGLSTNWFSRRRTWCGLYLGGLDWCHRSLTLIPISGQVFVRLPTGDTRRPILHHHILLKFAPSLRSLLPSPLPSPSPHTLPPPLSAHWWRSVELGVHPIVHACLLPAVPPSSSSPHCPLALPISSLTSSS